MEQLQLQKQSLEQQVKELIVHSEIGGIVVEVSESTEGASQTEQHPLILIGTLDQMVVEGIISEYDSLKIEEEQSCTISSEALPD